MKREAALAKTARQQLWIALIAIGLLACSLVGRAAIAEDVVAWGRNTDGECNVPAGLTGVVAVSAGGLKVDPVTGHSLALKSDGTVVAWGSNCYGQCDVPAGLTGVAAISAGGAHNLALKSDGSIVAWGNNAAGQCNVPALPAGVTYTMIAAGYYHNAAVRSDGKVVGWGWNDFGQANPPADLTGVVAISAGGLNHCLALKSDGTVVGWGLTIVPPDLPEDVVAVDAGWVTNMALTSDGTVVTWIRSGGSDPLPPGLTEAIAISAGGSHRLALKPDRTVIAWGYNQYGQCNVPADLANVLAIAAGSYHSLALVSVNEPPTIVSITAPVDPVAVGVPVEVSAEFTDPNAADTHTAEWSWGDESTSAGTVDQEACSVSGSHSYADAGPGVYTLSLTVTDAAGESDTATCPTYIVIYDPTAGFVTGGGWITSPPGAYLNEPALVGKANFGFTAKYQQGAEFPSGQTQFRFHVADLDFHSTDYQWLVVAGAKAKFKGRGTLDGTGDYAFMVTAIDGQLDGGGGTDRFRIKIWDPDDEEVVIYDNRREFADDSDAATALGGGSIVIHQGD